MAVIIIVVVAVVVNSQPSFLADEYITQHRTKDLAQDPGRLCKIQEWLRATEFGHFISARRSKDLFCVLLCHCCCSCVD